MKDVVGASSHCCNSKFLDFVANSTVFQIKPLNFFHREFSLGWYGVVLIWAMPFSVGYVLKASAMKALRGLGE